MFGFTAEEIESVGLPLSMGFLMLYMLFIIANLAKESKAGKLGTFVLFFVLAFGIFGFVMKHIIAHLMGI